MKIIDNYFGWIGKEIRSYLRFYPAKNVTEFLLFFLAHIEPLKLSLTILA